MFGKLEDRRVHIMIHLAECFEQHLCRSGIQRTGRLICEDQFRTMNHRSGTGTTLLLAPGYLIGEFIPDF